MTYEEKMAHLETAEFWRSKQEFTLAKVAKHLGISTAGASMLMTEAVRQNAVSRHELRNGGVTRLTFTQRGEARDIAFGPWRKRSNEQLGIVA